MTISRAYVSTHRGDVIYLEAVRWLVNCFIISRTMFNLILLLVKLITHTYWTSMFWSIDSCQNRVPADQYHLTVLRAQVSTQRSQVFFLKLSADKLLVFKWSQAQVKVFSKFIWNMLWPRTRKFSQLLQAGKTVAFDFCHHGHALITLYVHVLCSDWSKFDRWVHAENLCSVWKLA